MLAPQPTVRTLANGVRVLTLPMPERATCAVSVFVRTGSAHEARREAGISHVVEHMVFKGTATRDARRINRDAEGLGAEVNAHTDKDHTAFHMRGLAEHAADFVRMLADVVLHARFPADELEHERQVLLQEFSEIEDDPMATAFKLLDSASFGTHPAAMPVIGSRALVERLRREQLADYVQRQYSGCNIVVAASGGIDAEAVQRAAAAVFGDLRAGTPNRLNAAPWRGGLKTRHLAGSTQTHAVIAFPAATLADDDLLPGLAATLFGEGMSSPLMDELREQRGLLYYAAASADVLDCCGQFVVELSTAPRHLHEAVAEVLRLLRAQADGIAAADLDRAHNQARVRLLRTAEQPAQRLEELALELLALDRVRPLDETLQRLRQIDTRRLAGEFGRMLRAPAALAVTGHVARGTSAQLQPLIAA